MSLFSAIMLPNLHVLAGVLHVPSMLKRYRNIKQFSGQGEFFRSGMHIIDYVSVTSLDGL